MVRLSDISRGIYMLSMVLTHLYDFLIAVQFQYMLLALYIFTVWMDTV